MSVRYVLARILSGVAEIVGGTSYRQRSQRQIRDHCVVGNGAILTPSFSVDVRNANEATKDIVIDDEAFLMGRLVLERKGARIRIGKRVFIGTGTSIIASRDIEIGDDAMLSWNVTVVDHNSHSISWRQRALDTVRARQDYLQDPHDVSRNKDWSTVTSAPVRIGGRAWVGFNVVILKGVTIGEGAVVGAGSVVTKDVQPYTVVGGNPARLIRALGADEMQGGPCDS